MKRDILIAVAIAGFNPILASNSLRWGKSRDLEQKNKVAVIGAGISGLTAAYNLKKLGYNVIVFEAEDKVGGKIDSVYLEEGAPVNDFVDLTDEMEAKAQALCGDQRPTELGAVITSSPVIKALADELGVPYGEVGLDFKIVVGSMKIPQENYLGYLAAQVNPEDPLSEINKALQNFYTVVAEYPEITTMNLADGIDENKEELAKPLSEFAESHGITLLAESMRPLYAGYGYGYYETVPAGIFLPMIYYTVAQAGAPYISFPCGFQSLLDAMASYVDVRVKAKVTKVKRAKDYVEVKATGQKPLQFDSLIISASPDKALSFMNKKEFEYEIGLLGKVSGYKYMSTIANAAGSDGQYEVQFFADQGWEENRNSINVLAKTDISSSAETFYQIMSSETSSKEAFEVLQDNAETYWGGTIDTPIKQRLYDNYFPTVSSEDFPTFYTEIEKLQGYRNTYYVGSYLSFEVVPFCEEYSRQLVLRMFEELPTN